ASFPDETTWLKPKRRGRRVGLALTGKAPPCHGAPGKRKFGVAQNGTRAIFVACLSLGGVR
ncbi:MAG TPA: hypothetical protein VJ255_02400, partial [Candidatus Acidoferrum sp.]|nr:hypothetical protein [Candidatus Acidoferrum sp.]